MNTIYLMSWTDKVEDASALIKTEDQIVDKVVQWYWGELTNPNNGQLTIDVDFESLTVELHDSATDKVTTYYLFAFDRRVI